MFTPIRMFRMLHGACDGIKGMGRMLTTPADPEMRVDSNTNQAIGAIYL